MQTQEGIDHRQQARVAMRERVVAAPLRDRLQELKNWHVRQSEVWERAMSRGDQDRAFCRECWQMHVHAAADLILAIAELEVS